MFARFDENPAMTLRVIKETKRYGRTDRRTDGRTHGRTDRRTDGRTDGRTDNVKTVYPLQTKFAGGITNTFIGGSPNISLMFRLNVELVKHCNTIVPTVERANKSEYLYTVYLPLSNRGE